MEPNLDCFTWNNDLLICLKMKDNKMEGVFLKNEHFCRFSRKLRQFIIKKRKEKSGLFCDETEFLKHSQEKFEEKNTGFCLLKAAKYIEESLFLNEFGKNINFSCVFRLNVIYFKRSPADGNPYGRKSKREWPVRKFLWNDKILLDFLGK